MSAVAILLLLPGAAHAVTPTDELRGVFAAAGRVLHDPATEHDPLQRFELIRKIVAEVFDYRGAAQSSLGLDWQARSPAEREEFVRLFADLLERSYLWQVASKARLDEGVSVTYLEESVVGDHATVRTTIALKDGSEMPLDYRMVKRGDRWAVRDVIISGVSAVANYQAQIGRVIRGWSYAELVRRMKEKFSRAPQVAVAGAPGTGTTPMFESVPGTRPAAGPAATSSERPVATAAEPNGSVSGALASSDKGPVIERPPLFVLVPPPGGAAFPVGVGPPPGLGGLERGEAPRDAVTLARADADVRAPAPATVPTPAATSLAPPRAALSYWVQVGTFKNRATAERLVESLRRLKLPVWTGPVPASASGGATLSRVRVGPFAERTQASATLTDLTARGYQPFIAVTRE